MSVATTNPDEVGLSEKELRAIFPKLRRRPSYSAKALRGNVRTFAQGEVRRLRLQTVALEEWLQRDAGRRGVE